MATTTLRQGTFELESLPLQVNQERPEASELISRFLNGTSRLGHYLVGKIFRDTFLGKPASKREGDSYRQMQMSA